LAATRVYLLARDLGVKSSAIVKKCQDEGLDVKNHMAAISAGLAATIREWFTEGDNVTTVETAGKVDLAEVRVKRPVRKKVLQEGEEPLTPEEEAEAALIEEEEPIIEEEVVEEEVAPPPPEVIPTEPPTTPLQVEVPAPKPVVTPLVPELPKVEPPKVEEKKPEIIVLPAGPMLEKPQPAILTGPQVVRVEAPEPLDRPRSRSRPRPRFDGPVTEPLMRGAKTDTAVVAKGETDQKHGPHKDRTHGRRKEDTPEEEGAKKPAHVKGKWRQRDIEERQARLTAAGGEGLRIRRARKITSKSPHEAAASERPHTVTVHEPITVKDLSSALAVKATDIISKLLAQGVMATANQAISAETAELIAVEYETELVVERQVSLADQIKREFENRPREHLARRPVVVAMLGHVDHGKTSLLDKIRSTQVAAGEAGGITQHIGASQVTWNGKTATFLDTPGHEAFTAMRARGANMTDIVVLVVAADDGVMPQTIEAIAHSKAAEVKIVVALNKIDLPGCDINRIYAQLSEHGLTPAEWGGDTEVVKTSAATGLGISDLLEALDYVAELLDLKADDTLPATGWVVEAKMSAQQGSVATLLVKEGQLNKGDILLAGDTYGRVKAMKTSFGKKIKTATSAMPVEVTGLNGVPQAGDSFFCLSDINRAKDAAEQSRSRARERSLVERTHVTMENLFSQIEAGNVKDLNVIIRADVQGSVDVLKKYISEFSTSEVRVNILQAMPGGITEGDVLLAEVANAIIIGFNVVADERAAKQAETVGVDIRLYNIIYRITEDLQKSMVGLLEPEEQEKPLGRAQVRATFKVSHVGTVAGCFVTQGVVAKSARARLIRNNIVVRDGLTLESLKHFKDDAREVKAGLECGIKVAGYDDIKVDDIFDFYEVVKVARTLGS
jgi:translation initiation factor IF-2